MRIGSLNRQVQIQSRTTVPDPLGGEVVTWVPLYDAWADIRYLNGSETLAADAVVATAKASIRIRRRDGVLPTCRVLHRGTVFNILAVLPDEAGREYMDLACETGGNDG